MLLGGGLTHSEQPVNTGNYTYLQLHALPAPRGPTRGASYTGQTQRTAE